MTQLSIVEIKNEIAKQVPDKETMLSLIETSFKGLTPELAKKALLEGMMRGFEFTDFLKKNLYAIPFEDKRTGVLGYSLITSIDYARKVGMRSGICGTSAPTYEYEVIDNKKQILSCTITVKRKIGDYIGDYTATVFFKEYNTGRNQWVSKPHTMIAKVAEMHALRKACPEELSQAYVEEEYGQDVILGQIAEEKKIDKTEEFKLKLENCKNLDELKLVWAEIPPICKQPLESLKQELKQKYDNQKI